MPRCCRPLLNLLLMLKSSSQKRNLKTRQLQFLRMPSTWVCLKQHQHTNQTRRQASSRKESLKSHQQTGTRRSIWRLSRRKAWSRWSRGTLSLHLRLQRFLATSNKMLWAMELLTSTLTIYRSLGSRVARPMINSSGPWNYSEAPRNNSKWWHHTIASLSSL